MTERLNDILKEGFTFKKENHDNYSFFDGNTSTDILSILEDFKSQLKSELSLIVEGMFEKMILKLPKRLFLFKEAYNCSSLKVIYEFRDFISLFKTSFNKKTILINTLDQLSKSSQYYYFYYTQRLSATLLDTFYSPKIRFSFPDEIADYHDLYVERFQDNEYNNENENNLNSQKKSKITVNNRKKKGKQEKAKCQVFVEVIQNSIPLFQEARVRHEPLYSLQYQKKERKITFKNYKPGLIVETSLTMNSMLIHPQFVDEDFEKMEVTDWLYDKTVLEKLIAIPDEYMLKEKQKENLSNTFFYYDCEDKMRLREVSDTLEFLMK